MTTPVHVNPDADPFFVDLLGALPEHWAHLDADDDGEATALAYIRAAYGRGYVAALEDVANK